MILIGPNSRDHGNEDLGLERSKNPIVVVTMAGVKLSGNKLMESSRRAKGMFRGDGL